MKDVPTKSTIKSAVEAFQPTVEGKLHAWVKVEHEGQPALSCVWSERADSTKMSVVFASNEQGVDVLAFARAINRSMKASATVVQMLLSLYQSHNGGSIASKIEY